jgi:long-chain acyl-CoA synthetase
MGSPLEGVEVEIFTEARERVAIGEAGEIGIRSPSAATGYAGLPEQTRESFWNGYFFPGDIGRKDAEGRVYLIGRKSLFINRGGFKVNPYEVEAVIRRHPGVREVAVVGVETPYGDQKVKAVIVLTAPCAETEIIDFCRESLADYKVPSIVEFRTELPVSSTGKLLRKTL